MGLSEGLTETGTSSRTHRTLSPGTLSTHHPGQKRWTCQLPNSQAVIFGERLGVLLAPSGNFGGHGPLYPPPQPPLMRPGHPETPAAKARSYLRFFQALWRGGGKALPAAYGAGFVSFLPPRGRWRRREAGDSAGTAAWRWEEGREGASGDEDGPQMPVMSCPYSAPVGRTRGAEITASPSTRRGKHREEIPTHSPGD